MSSAALAEAEHKKSLWNTTIGSLCDRFGGEVQTGPFGSQLHAADYSEHGIPVVMPQDMRNGRIVCDQIARVSVRHVEKLKRHVLRTGDVVYSRRGDVSRFAVVTTTENGWLCGTGSIRIRINCPDVDIGYVRRYLQQSTVGEWMQRHAKGLTMPNLNTEIVRALPFVFPPLPEQRRIAEVLDRAEALQAKRRAVLEQLDVLAQSIFLDMFGDPKSNPKHWPEQSMSSLFDEPPIFGTMIPGNGVASGWLVLRVANIQHWNLDLNDRKYVELPRNAIERHSVREGDLLLARAIASEEHLGKCVVAHPGSDRWAFDSHLMRLRFDRKQVAPEFIRHVLMTPGGRWRFLRASRKSTIQFNINTKEISALTLPVPPIADQQKFLSCNDAVEKLKARCRVHLAELDHAFSSLQHRAFRGEL